MGPIETPQPKHTRHQEQSPVGLGNVHHIHPEEGLSRIRRVALDSIPVVDVHRFDAKFARCEDRLPRQETVRLGLECGPRPTGKTRSYRPGVISPSSLKQVQAEDERGF
jgi:hypothetical protein